MKFKSNAIFDGTLTANSEAKIRDIQGPLVANLGVISALNGTASQYVRGDGTLATIPTTGGAGSAVYYYLNGSVNASVATYKQMSNTAVIGGGTDFTLTSNGLIAQFLTDAGNPNRTLIPGGAWNLEMYFSVSSAGGNQKFYVDLFKYDGTTFTLISSGSTNPEEITGGITTDLYITSIAVPDTALLVTDRLAVRVYIVDNAGGRTITLHTEDNNLCQIITTFAAGVSSLNGLSANTQYLAVGTAGTDFNIASSIDTHTFNIPSASALNRGLLTSANWITFNNKQDAITLTTTGSSGASTFIGNTLNVPTYTLAGLGGVPTTRTLTINGTTYDLSSDRSWTISAASVSSRTIQRFVATAGQTSFTITGGYTVGLVDVYRNGVKLDNATDITAANGTTIVLTDAAALNDIIEVYKFGSEFLANNALRQVTAFTATAGQTSFTVTYSVGLVDVYYNGSKLASSEFSATNGTSIGLTTAAQLNDIIEVIAYSYTVNAFTGVSGSGTANYIAKWTASGVLNNSLIYDNGTNVGIGTSTPSNTLDVVKAASHAIRVQNTANSSDAYFIAQNTAGAAFFGINATGPYIYTASSLPITFSPGNTEKMRITSGGLLAIGTSGSDWSTTLKALQVNTAVFSGQPGAEAMRLGSNFYFNSTMKYQINGSASMYGQDGGSHYWSTSPSGTAGADITFTERMRITSGGEFCVGTTTAIGAGLANIKGPANVYNLLVIQNSWAANAGNFLYFMNSAGTQAGAITHNTASTIVYYTGPSDQRLKSNIKNVEESVLPLFKDAKLKTYNHIADKDESIVYKGFLAQDMIDNFPEAYGTDKEGFYTFNPSGYIPYLVKAIQELNLKIEKQQETINTLINK